MATKHDETLRPQFGQFCDLNSVGNTQRLMFARRPFQDPPTNHHGESDGAAPAGAFLRSNSAQPLSSPLQAGDVTERRFARAGLSIFFTYPHRLSFSHAPPSVFPPTPSDPPNKTCHSVRYFWKIDSLISFNIFAMSSFPNRSAFEIGISFFSSGSSNG